MPTRGTAAAAAGPSSMASRLTTRCPGKNTSAWLSKWTSDAEGTPCSRVPSCHSTSTVVRVSVTTDMGGVVAAAVGGVVKASASRRKQRSLMPQKQRLSEQKKARSRARCCGGGADAWTSSSRLVPPRRADETQNTSTSASSTLATVPLTRVL